MCPFYKKTFVLIICFLMLAIPQVYALFEDIPYETMVERADLIIIGKMNGAFEERTEKVEWPEVEKDHYFGLTDWKIEVTSYLKGKSQGDFMLVTTPGIKGEIDGAVADFRYRSNEYLLDELIESMEKELKTEVEDILFFLEERDGYYHPFTPKAILPLNIVHWEENIGPNVLNMKETDPKVLEELEYLQGYLNNHPDYSPANNGQSWYPYATAVLPLGLLVWYFNSKRRK